MREFLTDTLTAKDLGDLISLSTEEQNLTLTIHDAAALLKYLAGWAAQRAELFDGV